MSSGLHRAAQAAQGLNPCGKPCGVPGVAQGVPCPGPSAPASSPTITYHIAGDHNTNNYHYTTNNYSYVTNAGVAGATRGSRSDAAAAEPADHAPQACGRVRSTLAPHAAHMLAVSR